jgi:hypothetical protein
MDTARDQPASEWIPAAEPVWMLDGRRAAAARLGALVGAAVAVMSLLTFAAFQVVNGNDTGFPRTIDEVLWVALPSLVAGTLGGWRLGARAGRARTRGDWVGTVFLLALLTTAIGAVLTGIEMALGSMPAADPGSILVALAQGVGLGGIGIIVLGWLAAPVLLVPAGVWALAMRALLPRRG